MHACYVSLSTDPITATATWKRFTEEPGYVAKLVSEVITAFRKGGDESYIRFLLAAAKQHKLPYAAAMEMYSASPPPFRNSVRPLVVRSMPTIDPTHCDEATAVLFIQERWDKQDLLVPAVKTYLATGSVSVANAILACPEDAFPAGSRAAASDLLLSVPEPHLTLLAWIMPLPIPGPLFPRIRDLALRQRNVCLLAAVLDQDPSACTPAFAFDVVCGILEERAGEICDQEGAFEALCGQGRSPYAAAYRIARSMSKQMAWGASVVIARSRLTSPALWLLCAFSGLPCAVAPPFPRDIDGYACFLAHGIHAMDYASDYPRSMLERAAAVIGKEPLLTQLAMTLIRLTLKDPRFVQARHYPSPEFTRPLVQIIFEYCPPAEIYCTVRSLRRFILPALATEIAERALELGEASYYFYELCAVMISDHALPIDRGTYAVATWCTEPLREKLLIAARSSTKSYFLQLLLHICRVTRTRMDISPTEFPPRHLPWVIAIRGNASWVRAHAVEAKPYRVIDIVKMARPSELLFVYSTWKMAVLSDWHTEIIRRVTGPHYSALYIEDREDRRPGPPEHVLGRAIYESLRPPLTDVFSSGPRDRPIQERVYYVAEAIGREDVIVLEGFLKANPTLDTLKRAQKSGAPHPPIVAAFLKIDIDKAIVASHASTPVYDMSALRYASLAESALIPEPTHAREMITVLPHVLSGGNKAVAYHIATGWAFHPGVVEVICTHPPLTPDDEAYSYWVAFACKIRRPPPPEECARLLATRQLPRSHELAIYAAYPDAPGIAQSQAQRVLSVDGSALLLEVV